MYIEGALLSKSCHTCFHNQQVSVAHIDGSQLTSAERAKGVGVRLQKNYNYLETPTDSILSIPESGIVKVSIDPAADAERYSVKVSDIEVSCDSPFLCQKTNKTKNLHTIYIYIYINTQKTSPKQYLIENVRIMSSSIHYK